MPLTKSKKAVIFGTGGFAEVVDFYLTHDSAYDVVGFTATGEFDDGVQFRGRALIPFDTLHEIYGPGEADMFIAVGYRKLNALRLQFMEQAAGKGYRLLSYISSRCSHWVGTADGTEIGANVFVFEDNTLQPFVAIGDGTILWSGNHIGHHSKIGRGCFISSHVVVSGHCTVGDQTFIGVNAAVSEGVNIAARNLIGPSTLIQHDTKLDEAYIGERTKAHKVKSSRFMR